jgi:hypothetical protein
MSDISEPPAAVPIERIEGPSFTPVMKALSTAFMLALAYWCWQALQVGAWGLWVGQTRWFLLLVMLAVLCGYWGIMTSRTGIDGYSIRQSWLWPKEVRLAEITRVKLIHVPGFAWLMAPRLVVRAGGLVPTTFHAADKRVLAAFARLAYGA